MSYGYTQPPVLEQPINGDDSLVPSCTGWIIGLVVFVVIALGFGIWLLVLY